MHVTAIWLIRAKDSMTRCLSFDLTTSPSSDPTSQPCFINGLASHKFHGGEISPKASAVKCAILVASAMGTGSATGDF